MSYTPPIIDVMVTGQGSQTALNNNIILATAGSGSYDTVSSSTGNMLRSLSIQVVPAAGTVTAGAITFEGSNDNTNWTPIFLLDEANITAVPVSSYTLVAATPRYFKGALAWRYVRARISTGVTGTTTGVQAFTRFSSVPFSDQRLTVSQATAASLNVTSTMTSTTLTAVTPGTAATNLGKARDSAIGATDTGVAVLGVRRDAPTAETPVAGDYVVPQVSANGEQWVGMAASATNSPAKARDAVAGASDTAIPAAFVRRDTPTAVTPAAGDYEFGQIDDKGRQYVITKAPTSATTSVAASATNVTLLASNNARAGATIYNDSTAILYVKLGATASTTSFAVALQSQEYYEVPFGYTGIIDGIWASATGNARITELT